MGEYDFLRQALREAVEEKRMVPHSSRLRGIIDAVRAHLGVAQAHLDAAKRLDQKAKDAAASSAFPEDLVRLAYGDTQATQRKWEKEISELNAIIAEGEKAAGSLR